PHRGGVLLGRQPTRARCHYDHSSRRTCPPGDALGRTGDRRLGGGRAGASHRDGPTMSSRVLYNPVTSGTHMTQPPGALFERLLKVMARLRGPGGCPWDREQTRTSLKPYIVEETYEVLEAIEGADPRAVEEELGDLLFQVVFHAQIAQERGEFTMADVLVRLCDKMVSRHPHVFGDASVNTAGDALAQWEAIKQRQAEDAGRRRSVIDGVPR